MIPHGPALHLIFFLGARALRARAVRAIFRFPHAPKTFFYKKNYALRNAFIIIDSIIRERTDNLAGRGMRRVGSIAWFVSWLLMVNPHPNVANRF